MNIGRSPAQVPPSPNQCARRLPRPPTAATASDPRLGRPLREVQNSSILARASTPSKGGALQKGSIGQKSTPLLQQVLLQRGRGVSDVAGPTQDEPRPGVASPVPVTVERASVVPSCGGERSLQALQEELAAAAKRDDPETMRRCLQEGALPNDRDLAGWGPLHDSASRGYLDACEVLLQFRADVDAVLPYPDLSTPLMLAVEEGHLAVAQLLLVHGARTDCQDFSGFTALERCDDLVRDEFVRCLQQRGLR